MAVRQLDDVYLTAWQREREMFMELLEINLRYDVDMNHDKFESEIDKALERMRENRKTFEAERIRILVKVQSRNFATRRKRDQEKKTVLDYDIFKKEWFTRPATPEATSPEPTLSSVEPNDNLNASE